MDNLGRYLNLDEILIDRRKRNCFPTKHHPIRTSGLTNEDFPSKIRLAASQTEFEEEEYGEATVLEERDTKNSCSIKEPISSWRLVNSNDVDDITELVDKWGDNVEELFRMPDIPDLIEKSSFAFSQFNNKGKMISFTATYCNPNIPVVPSFDWFDWLENMYEIDGITPRNSCFIHYMVWNPEYHADFLRLSLEVIFMQFPFMKFIVLIKPPLVEIPELVSEHFIPVLPKNIQTYSWEPNSVQIFLLCLRHSLLDRQKIRLAVVEDHDDLMPIIERQTTKLRELYGDFCMAEIIEYPGTENRKTLVCESNGRAVAFMNLNRFVDLEVLNGQFDLGVFHGLRKPSPEDSKAEVIEEDEEKVIYLPEKVSSSLDLINSETMDFMFKWRPKICASEEEVEDVSETEESVDSNGLSRSIVEMIRDSTEANIFWKFSAHSLISLESSYRDPFSSEEGEDKNSIIHEPSLLSLSYFNPPVFHGPPNTFCIELFAVHEDFDEKLCSDFMEAAFELFPDLEYCMIAFPSQCSVFPLLDLFVRVTPRPMKTFKQELYVCHKSSVMLTFMRVRRIRKSDLPEIYRMLKGIESREFIYADVANSCIFPDTAYQGFVLIASKTIVGAAVVCNENGLEYLTQHYHVSDLIEFELHKMDYHAVLKHFILSPIYQTHARFFLRDIMRMADITSMYRARYEERMSALNTSSLITALGQLVPVKPRRMVKYHVPSLGQNTPPPHFLNYDAPFALYHINWRICSLQKLTSNMNILIVGTSRTAISFLENLLYAPNSAYVTYNNITWVSPHGTGLHLAPHPARDLIFPYRGKYNRRYRAQISLHSFANIVYGVMTHINRSEKYIVINNSAILIYDYLILLCGKQYSMPIPLVRQEDPSKCHRKNRPRCSLFKYLVTQKEGPKDEEKIEYPSNVFLINTSTDASNAFVTMQYIMRKKKYSESKKQIIIYGRSILTYLCTQSLLKFGIPPELMVLVVPPPKKTDIGDYLTDPNVEEAIANILKELKITLYKGYVLYDWVMCEDNQIGTVIFHSKHEKITLGCLALFPYEPKQVSDVTFKAVNEASIVYDGRVVINNRFQTNDPYIYAAGAFTKYQRKYFADDKSHEFYDGTEAGKLLAEIIRLEVDPTEMGNKEESRSDEIPELTRPILISGQFPGDWNYFHLRAPGKEIPLEVQCNMQNFGDTLITGDCYMTDGYGYFKIHIDSFGIVRTITCFTKDEVDVENYPMLYGKHEKYLNNLLTRFNLGLIKDFFSYFREPWVYVLYHDRFIDLMKANYSLFDSESSIVDKKLLSLIDDVLRENKTNKIHLEHMEDIMKIYEYSNIRDKITRNVARYLDYFQEAFPMYATNAALRMLLHDEDEKGYE